MLLCIRCHKATVLKCNVLNRCPVLRILVAGNIYIIAISLPRSLRFNDGSMSMHTNTTWLELIYLSRRKENNSKSVTISCIVWWTGLKWHLFLFFSPGVIGHAHPQAPKPWWLQIMLLCCFVFLWRGACTSAHVPVPPLSNRWGEVGEVKKKPEWLSAHSLYKQRHPMALQRLILIRFRAIHSNCSPNKERDIFKRYEIHKPNHILYYTTL
jgi:hypothetical protein